MVRAQTLFYPPKSAFFPLHPAVSDNCLGKSIGIPSYTP